MVIADSAMASPEGLTMPLAAIVTTQGKALVEERLAIGSNPKRLTVNSEGSFIEEPADV